MKHRSFRLGDLGFFLMCGGMALVAPLATPARAQPPTPVPVQPPTPVPDQPPTPNPDQPPTPAAPEPPAAPPPAESAEQLKQRIRQLESNEAQLKRRMQEMEALYAKMSKRLDALPATPARAQGGAAGTKPGAAGGSGGAGGSAGAGSSAGAGGSASAAQATASPPGPNMPATQLNIPGKVRFGPGFEISTQDDEFTFQFHDLTQLDGRFYQQGGQVAAHDTFTFPRNWFIFAGRLTKPYEYFLSFTPVFNNFTFLWIWLNIHYDDRLQFKVGRIFTPFGYEWYQVPTGFLINPERSHFINNIAPVTDIGLTAWGQLAKKRIDYAVGIYNGTRNSSFDFNDSKDLIAFLNFKPFLESDIEPLKYLNVGGSVDTGNQFNTPLPPDMRTNVQTGAAIGSVLPTGPEFLVWNSNARESGWRAFWDLHVAYFYRHLSLLAEWQSGFQDYALANTPNFRTHVPIGGFYTQAGYFLTGETVTGRNVVRPNRDFDIRKGKCGPGAIELAARYQMLHLGSQVFTAGLVDPNLWTNQVSSIDLGVNWYLNRFIKVYMGWQHDMFGQPVLFAPGRRQLTNDQAWLRFQIFF